MGQKRRFIVLIIVLLISICAFPQEMKRMLVVVEKVAGSIGFYDENGNHIKSLSVGKLPHEIVITPDSKYAFVTINGSLRYVDDVEGGNTVQVINLEKMELEKPIQLGKFRRPHGIFYDQVSKLLAVTVENPGRLLIIDPEKRKIISDYDNYGKTPHMVSLSPGAEYAFISNTQSESLTILNLKTESVNVVRVGNKPQESVLSADGKFLYVACDNHIAVVDLNNKILIGTIGRGANRIKLVKDGSLLVYSSTKRGFGFANPLTYKEVFHLDIPFRSFSMNVSPDEKYLYLAAEEQNLIYVASLDEMKIVKKIKLPDGTNPDPVKEIWVEKSKLPAPPVSKAKIPDFKRIVIDSTFSRGYQVKTADINGDLKLDIIAVSDSLPEVYWYENPTWEKHLITNKSYRNIDVAPYDIDGDGDIDLALATRFELSKSKEGGYIYWLENPDDTEKEWNMTLIDSIPSSHRIRWADIDGNGRKELINITLVGYGASAPDYLESATVRGYIVPPGPKWQPWEKIQINNSLHMAHGVSVVRWDADLRDDLLTASFEGITLHKSLCDTKNFMWELINITTGQQKANHLYTGASEISSGFLNHTDPFLASIEPWHGNEVVVYYPGIESAKPWERHVIDTTFDNGHAIQCADLNFDGNSEVIAGHRGFPYNLFIYQYEPEYKSWKRIPLDMGGMSAAGLAVFDYNYDGFPDIVACGSATGNIVLYENLKIEIPRK